MIDYRAKIIKLGYGDVCVGSVGNQLTFQNIKPTQECGTQECGTDITEDVAFAGERVLLPFNSIEDVNYFAKMLDFVASGKECAFCYDRWLITFLPDSSASLGVVNDHFGWVKRHVLYCTAC